jgi:AcrR family transcriptional regulator
MNKMKKEAVAAFNRNNIIDAAKKLFQRKGFDKTTMDDIAKKADYSKSTIYVYFKSKDEIYNSIICEYMTLLRDTLDSTIKSIEGFAECYFAICKKIVEFQENYPMYYESLLGKIDVSNINLEQNSIVSEIYRVGEEINQIISNLLKRGIDKNFLRTDIEILPTVFYLWSSISGIVSMSGNKKQYFKARMGLNKQDYLDYSFRTLLESIIK